MTTNPSPIAPPPSGDPTARPPYGDPAAFLPRGGPTAPPYRLLRRPTTDRVVAGVASGIGRYFGVDPVLVRAGFVAAAAATWGAALLAYPIMWFLIPEDQPGLG